jgi:hypothetical protein
VANPPFFEVLREPILGPGVATDAPLHHRRVYGKRVPLGARQFLIRQAVLRAEQAGGGWDGILDGGTVSGGRLQGAAWRLGKIATTAAGSLKR